MAENKDADFKNGKLNFKKRRGIYVPVAPTTILPIRDLSSFWRWIGAGNKTLWNWLEILIVPLFLSGVAVYFQSQVETRREAKIAAERYQQETQIAAERYQQEVLAKYLDQMTALLLEENLRWSAPDSEVRSIARARTIAALSELDAMDKRALIRFLYESNLISTNQTIISLNDTDLGHANLDDTSMRDVNLSGANLTRANLTRANLRDANLGGANLDDAELGSADLSGANLSGANLRDANLGGANLDDANLSEVSLCETTMPDGKVENRDCPP